MNELTKKQDKTMLGIMRVHTRYPGLPVDSQLSLQWIWITWLVTANRLTVEVLWVTTGSEGYELESSLLQVLPLYFLPLLIQQCWWAHFPCGITEEERSSCECKISVHTVSVDRGVHLLLLCWPIQTSVMEKSIYISELLMIMIITVAVTATIYWALERHCKAVCGS